MKDPVLILILILDFGISSSLIGAETKNTFCGTSIYMSYEMALKYKYSLN